MLCTVDVAMGDRKSQYISPAFSCFFLLLLKTCTASVRQIGALKPGFKASQFYYIDNDGLFLLSNNSNFAFGLTTTENDVTLFLLVVMHISSTTTVWSANRGSPVKNSDNFMFDDNGNAYLQNGGSTVWSTGTSNKGVSAIELWNSGNLVLIGNDRNVIWQSFSHPTNTLLSSQIFSQGMVLTSDLSQENLTYSLEVQPEDMMLSASFNPPQSYWSISSDTRTIVNKGGGNINSVVLDGNSWKVYGSNNVLLSQFILSSDTNTNTTWVAVLGNDGFVTFTVISGGSTNPSPTRIPSDQCSTPVACQPYSICYTGHQCLCPSTLASCNSMAFPSCDNNTTGSVHLVSGGDGLNYFALGFVDPFSKTDLNGCKASCLGNCSCGAMFFDQSSGDCFMFNAIGSMEGSIVGANYTSFIKIIAANGKLSGVGGGKLRLSIIIVIVLVAVTFIFGLFFVGIYLFRRNKKVPGSTKDGSEEDNFLENLSGMPIRFSYKDLQMATDNFTLKLGQGGFGSVYRGTLPDGTQIAVKKLEGFNQGKKEFRAEVSIIGSIHHLHLVRLKGFCAEGSYRLLAYEFMANGSLEKWLFRKGEKDEPILDWDTRYNIAVGTAKGLAYLHEDCDVKIVHCDIKPENVLLDDNFMAKVSDFGLAKLMTREQSHVFTTMRGTRGYLAPEWITSYAISEKSDVYSYGMVLLELISGRKNYTPTESSGKSHFPSYAFKMMEEGNPTAIIDDKLKIVGDDERVGLAIKVALWCIQDDMHLRPPMARVVQMLEGVSPVPLPPVAAGSESGSRFYMGLYRSPSEEGTSSGTSDYVSNAYLSEVRLSGPR